jgi:hypothetical protein
MKNASGAWDQAPEAFFCARARKVQYPAGALHRFSIEEAASYAVQVCDARVMPFGYYALRATHLYRLTQPSDATATGHGHYGKLRHAMPTKFIFS